MSENICYWAWQSDPKQTPAREIAAALTGYQDRYGCAPAEILMRAIPVGVYGTTVALRAAPWMPAGVLYLGPVPA